MSNIDKFNNPGDSGNPFGPLIKGDRVPGDNGRTPINPDADGNKDMKRMDIGPSSSSKSVSPTKA